MRVVVIFFGSGVTSPFYSKNGAKKRLYQQSSRFNKSYFRCDNYFFRAIYIYIFGTSSDIYLLKALVALSIDLSTRMLYIEFPEQVTSIYCLIYFTSNSIGTLRHCASTFVPKLINDDADMILVLEARHFQSSTIKPKLLLPK